MTLSHPKLGGDVSCLDIPPIISSSLHPTWQIQSKRPISYLVQTLTVAGTSMWSDLSRQIHCCQILGLLFALMVVGFISSYPKNLSGTQKRQLTQFQDSQKNMILKSQMIAARLISWMQLQLACSKKYKISYLVTELVTNIGKSWFSTWTCSQTLISYIQFCLSQVMQSIWAAVQVGDIEVLSKVGPANVNTSKLVTTVVSTFTSYYVHLWATYFPAQPLTSPLPSFDGRAVCYPSIGNLRDYMSWRQVDCKHVHII